MSTELNGMVRIMEMQLKAASSLYLDDFYNAIANGEEGCVKCLLHPDTELRRAMITICGALYKNVHRADVTEIFVGILNDHPDNNISKLILMGLGASYSGSKDAPLIRYLLQIANDEHRSLEIRNAAYEVCLGIHHNTKEVTMNREKFRISDLDSENGSRLFPFSPEIVAYLA